MHPVLPEPKCSGNPFSIMYPHSQQPALAKTVIFQTKAWKQPFSPQAGKQEDEIMTSVTDITPKGYRIAPHEHSRRLQVVTLQADTIAEFIRQTERFPVQALEYKPFNRFRVAEILDSLCEYTLGKFLLGTLKNRATGAFLLKFEGGDKKDTDFFVKLGTAVSHLIGRPNFDAMSQKYYARFTVRNVDNSDSYLRQPHRRMELHNDGTFVDEPTDYVLMMKMQEENMQGGNSLILHLDDWAELDKFYNHPIAKKPITWEAPPSKNVTQSIEHPVFIDNDPNGRPRLHFIDQFAKPKNREEGLYLFELGESLENDPNFVSVRVEVGDMLVVENHNWLHGRDKFVAHPDLLRELMRQRGQFVA
ncbi:carbon starvation induced protein CsiD [Neisseria sp. ZJ106]|uniref:Carbon starvation induced protein CsiD n=1 Tax=Neisseria lisongii TaxID=2912188 RepID=A0AAW5ASH3_9NEIS|nr:glutarate dioxygenase GlaH [Neisseria lisongii]MCF7522020.1 carbon starvation induced protein CsiD [Neisseria lisongii]MCF7530348.1 carbon starvation induced protein CsiD [Neisseria lisongii]WCL71097.1 glutarate dioxygenase GlaH [Neisseria lisongii]